MSLPIAQESPLNSLFSLKSQYENELIEAEAKAKTIKEQIEHINALLLHQLVPSNSTSDNTPLQTQIETSTTDILLIAEEDPLPNRLAPAQEEEEVPTPSNTSEQTAPPKPASRKGKRSSPKKMRSIYKELTRLKAITKVMEKHKGQELSADRLTKELFGTMNTVEHKAETKRLKTTLYKGEKEKLWQKGKAPSTYIIKGEKKNSKGSSSRSVSPTKRSTTKAKVTKAKVTKPQATKIRSSLSLLPAYKGLQKHEAITAVLEKHRGTAVHQDAIIEMLYGQLSPEAFKAERPRTKTALQAGVKTKKWQKARKPACFQLPKTTKKAVTQKTGQKAKAPKSVAAKTPAATTTSRSTAKAKRGQKANASSAKTPPKSKTTTARKRATKGRTKKA